VRDIPTSTVSFTTSTARVRPRWTENGAFAGSSVWWPRWRSPDCSALSMAPEAAGGRLYSDTMGRLAFILFLLYSLPVGLHHLFMDPEHSTGFKFVQTTLTALVTVPTLLTVFTIAASFEVAGRLNGGTGLSGNPSIAQIRCCTCGS
jgi:hypothetical protein